MAGGDWWDRFWGDLSATWKRFWIVVAVALALCLCGGIVWAVYTPRTPSFHNPNFVDAILENRLVMAAVRIAIIGITIYIIISVVGHISARRWLSVAGPLKVADSAVRAVDQEANALQEQLETAQTTIEDLGRRLKTTDEALGVANRERDEIIQEWSREKKKAGHTG